MFSKKFFSGTGLKCVIAIGLGLAMTISAIIFFSTVVSASGYNPDSGWAIDASNINTDMRAFSSQAYNADYDESSWVYHNTKDGDNYKPHMGDIIVYGCYPYGVDYFGDSEIATSHVEICVEDYNEDTGCFGAIGGNTGYSATTPYYLGSAVAFTYHSWNDYYLAAYGDRFIYNIWQAVNTDIAENIVYSTYRELDSYNADPDTYRQVIFSMQGERNWCDIFVSRTLQNTVESPPKDGYLTLVKTSGVGDITNSQIYSLKDAVYGVYTDYECDASVDILRTDENGNTETLTLQEGTYYVKELTPSEGHKKDETIHTAVVTAGETTVVTSVEPPVTGNGSISITKKCVEGYSSYNTLAGAVFLVSYYATYGDYSDMKPVSKWTMTTSYNLENDAYMAIGEYQFKLGTYVIEEIKAPAGYLIDNNIIYSNSSGVPIKYSGKYVYIYRDIYKGRKIDADINITVENYPKTVPEETTEEATTEEKTTEKETTRSEETTTEEVTTEPEETTTEEETTEPTEITTGEVTTIPKETTEPVKETTAEHTTAAPETSKTVTTEAETTTVEITTSGDNGPKTGDKNNIEKYIAAICIALGIIGTCALIIRRKRIK